MEASAASAAAASVALFKEVAALELAVVAVAFDAAAPGTLTVNVPRTPDATVFPSASATCLYTTLTE